MGVQYACATPWLGVVIFGELEPVLYKQTYNEDCKELQQVRRGDRKILHLPLKIRLIIKGTADYFLNCLVPYEVLKGLALTDIN